MTATLDTSTTNTSTTDTATTNAATTDRSMRRVTPPRQPDVPFRPHRLAQSATVQTLAARYYPRGVDWFLAHEEPLLIDAGPDVLGHDTRVRLLAYYNTTPVIGPSRGLVMTFHGWEGCSHSAHNLNMTDALLRAGYDVVRLNLRDHGPSLHLDAHRMNRGVFLGTLIDETAVATHYLAALAGDRPFYMIGPSMGGNFVLRLAARHAKRPFHNLQRVVAICPALNPGTATDAIDAKPTYRRYFRRNWLTSLLKKQANSPHLYNFAQLTTIPTIRAMTAWLVRHYSHYQDVNDYFSRYSVPRNAFRDLAVPVTVVTARNDPVIPAGDFYALEPHPLLDVQIYPTGGHVGFVDLFPPRRMLPEIALHALAK